MRAAAVLSATIIVLGIYLAFAAAFGISASGIGIGILTIAATGAAGVMATASRGVG